jgi:hypothetical protein
MAAGPLTLATLVWISADAPNLFDWFNNYRVRNVLPLWATLMRTVRIRTSPRSRTRIARKGLIDVPAYANREPNARSTPVLEAPAPVRQ